MGAEVVGQLFDDKFGHDVAHLQGEQNFTPKSLIYNDILGAGTILLCLYSESMKKLSFINSQ